jgi:hypothetical protein
VGTLIGVIAAVLIGLAAAGGVTFALPSPDNKVNLEEPAGAPDASSAFLDYGKRNINP